MSLYGPSASRRPYICSIYRIRTFFTPLSLSFRRANEAHRPQSIVRGSSKKFLQKNFRRNDRATRFDCQLENAFSNFEFAVCRCLRGYRQNQRRTVACYCDVEGACLGNDTSIDFQPLAKLGGRARALKPEQIAVMYDIVTKRSRESPRMNFVARRQQVHREVAKRSSRALLFRRGLFLVRPVAGIGIGKDNQTEHKPPSVDAIDAVAGTIGNKAVGNIVTQI